MKRAVPRHFRSLWCGFFIWKTWWKSKSRTVIRKTQCGFLLCSESFWKKSRPKPTSLAGGSLFPMNNLSCRGEIKIFRRQKMSDGSANDKRFLVCNHRQKIFLNHCHICGSENIANVSFSKKIEVDMSKITRRKPYSKCLKIYSGNEFKVWSSLVGTEKPPGLVHVSASQARTGC